MSYYIKYQDIGSACLLLSSLAASSERYVKSSLLFHGSTTHIDGDSKVAELDLDVSEYDGWLTHQIHSSLVYCAIHTRTLLDFDKLEPRDPDDESDPIANASTESYDRYEPVISQQGIASLSLRECCNKIIHAETIELLYIHLTDNEPRLKYWNGQVRIKGKKGRKLWEIVIDIPRLSFTIRHYLSAIRYLL